MPTSTILGIMFIVIGSQYEVIDTFNFTTLNRRESVQEDANLNISDNDEVYIRDKFPTPVKIVEMRVLDKDENPVASCPTDVSFSGGIEEPTAMHGSRYRQKHTNC